MFKLLYKLLTGEFFVTYFGGGSSSPPAQPSSTSQTTSNIPDWAIPYATRNLGKAEALTDINQNPYQTYQGNRVAGFSPLQTQAFGNIQGMTTNVGTGNAMNQTQDAYNRSVNAGLYQGPQFQNMGLAYLNSQAQNFGQPAAQAYMSPYQQYVTDFQKQEAIRDYGRQMPGLGAMAASKGAFGGTRQALVASEAQRNLQNQLGGIQALGSQNAFQNAQQQFNADEARQMQSQLANQGAYAQMQGLGMQQGLSANQQALQNAQFGVNYGLQNRQQALAAAGQLGALGQQQYAQQLGINTAQQQAGAQMQAQDQQDLSNRYQDFLNQQNYPYKQLGFMSDIMRGTPTSGGATSMYQAPANTLGQVAGLGLAGYMASGKAFQKEGGIISGYKRGGEVHDLGGLASLTDPTTEIAARSNLPPTDSALALAKFMLPVIKRMHQPIARRDPTTVAEDMAREILSRQPPQDMQQGMPQQPQGMLQGMQQGMQQGMLQPQGMQQGMQQSPQGMPQDMGIASLPVDNFQDENYRGGGIVAFAGGDEVISAWTKSPTGINILNSEAPNTLDTSPAGKYRDFLKEWEVQRAAHPDQSLEEHIKIIKDQRTKEGITGLLGAARMTQLEKDRASEDSRKQDASKNFWISTGLNMAAEASRRGNPQSGIGALLQPLSVGAKEALPGLLSEQEKLRGLIETRNKEISEIDNSRRLEAAGIITLGQAAKDKRDTRSAALDKAIIDAKGRIADHASTVAAAEAGRNKTDQESYARAYVEKKIAQGSTTNPVILHSDGMQEFLKIKGLESVKYAAIVPPADQALTAGQRADDAFERTIRAQLDEELNRRTTPQAVAGRAARNKDSSNRVENEKNRNDALPTNNYQRYYEAELQKRRDDRVIVKPSLQKYTANPLPPEYSKIQDAPPGGSVGVFVQGQGWEIKNASGKVIGYSR